MAKRIPMPDVMEDLLTEEKPDREPEQGVTEEKPALAGETEVQAEADEDIHLRAMEIVKKYMAWSAGAGVIPIPWIDIAAISGVQFKMLKSLADHYGVAFSAHRAKSILATLVSGYGANTLAFGSMGALLKSIPGPGTLFGMVSLPVCAGATTYAVGKVFIQHFASGGTFLNFAPQKISAHYARHFEDGHKGATTDVGKNPT